MATRTRAASELGTAAGAVLDAPEVARVRVPARSAWGELRAIKVVWKRELIRFSRDRLRILTALMQPFLFLFVLGTGLSRIASAGTHGVSLRTFVYPGVLCMAVMFTAMFSAASLVWDREFGFLREMMVAPVRRSSLVLGKCLGGATVAGFQGLIVLALAGLVGIPYNGGLLLEICLLMVMLAFTITAFGVMIAARVTQIELRVCGSSPTVGSSRNSTRGECSSPRAISRRRFIPPEKWLTRLSRRSHRPTISITCCIRRATSSFGTP